MQEEPGKKRILVTGSSGFLGRYLIKFAPREYHLISQFRSKKPEPYGRDLTFLKMDFLSESFKNLEDLKPNVIIHTAAMASIDDCEVNPDRARQINYDVTRRLIDFASNLDIRFIFISSDVIFDGERGNYSESDSPNPLNIYAETKVDAEQYILSKKANAVVVRPSLFYGLGLNGRPSFTETMLSNLRAGKQVFLFTDQYRTPVLVNNLTDALWELVNLDFTGIIHLGNNHRISRISMGQLLCELFKLDKNLLVPVKSSEAKLIAKRPLDCSLNTDLASSLLKTRFVDCHSGFNIAYH